MPGLSSYSTDATNNTTLLPPGANPGRVDDAMRQLQADISTDYRDREWTEYGRGDGGGGSSDDYSCGYVSPTTFQISGADVTASYHVGRAVRVVGESTGTIYGTIVGSSYDGVYTQVDVAWQSDGLASEAGLRVWISTLSGDGRAVPKGALDNRPIDMGGQPLTDPQLTSYSETRQTLAIDAGVVTWDLSHGGVGYVRLTEDITSIAIINWPSSPRCGSPVLYRQQDATGGRTMTGWPIEVVWFGGTEPAPTPDAYAVDAIGLSSMDGGVSILGASNLGALFGSYIG